MKKICVYEIGRYSAAEEVSRYLSQNRFNVITGRDVRSVYDVEKDQELTDQKNLVGIMKINKWGTEWSLDVTPNSRLEKVLDAYISEQEGRDSPSQAQSPQTS